MTVRVLPERRRAALAVAAQEGITPSELLRQALDEFLARRQESAA